MYLQGVELVVPLYMLAMIIIPVYAFVVLVSRVRHGVLKRSRAFLQYTGSVFSPIILYIIFFFLLVGIEELYRVSLISDVISRNTLILLGVGLIIWFVSSSIFAVVLNFVKVMSDGHRS